MSARAWSGRYSQRRVAATLAAKGTVCHLCKLRGATSADHNPPRSALIRAGVPDPDALRFLFPAHLSCNIWRKDRPLTDELRAELRARLLAARGVSLPRSARFGGNRPTLVILNETNARLAP